MHSKIRVFTTNYWFLSVSHSMFLLVTWNKLSFVAVEFSERQLILSSPLSQSVKKCYWKFQQSLWKLSAKKFSPDKNVVSRPESNNEFLQKSFAEIKFKLSYLTSCQKNSQYFRLVVPEHYQ